MAIVRQRRRPQVWGVVALSRGRRAGRRGCRRAARRGRARVRGGRGRQLKRDVLGGYRRGGGGAGGVGGWRCLAPAVVACLRHCPRTAPSRPGVSRRCADHRTVRVWAAEHPRRGSRVSCTAPALTRAVS